MLQHQNIEAQTGLTNFRCQLLLAAFYMVLVAAWSSGIAFNSAPDESTHFFLLEFLEKFHSLPASSEPHETLTGLISGRTWQKGEFWYHGLPFPHILGAVVTAKVGSWLLPADLLYLGARSFNWLLGAVFICALFRTARAVGTPLQIAALIAVNVALIPQVTFVFSYLNSDGYGLASIALLLSTMTNYINSPTRKRAMYLGLAIGLMLLAKLYFLPALVFASIMLTVNRLFKDRRVLSHLPTTLIAAAIVALPMLAVVYLKYGEVSGVSGQIDFVAMHKLNPAAGYGTCYFLCSDHLINTKNLLPWLSLTLASYFSVTGWMNIFIAAPYYLIAALLLLALMGAAFYQIRPLNKAEPWKEITIHYILPIVMIAGLYPAITLLSLIASQNSLPQPQGRYLFVTIPFLGLLISLTARRVIARRAQ
ncbi:hypothetical protein [Pseudomonas sp. NPDC088444]|uniref:hypothetical protein n=1 Tax=Pseudomonas sp. NPDC088444 TaxID=3364456 RepID=UPI00384E7F17